MGKKDDKTQARKQKRKGNNHKQVKETATEHGKAAKGRKDPENRSEENECGGKPKQKEERSHTLNHYNRMKPRSQLRERRKGRETSRGRSSGKRTESGREKGRARRNSAEEDSQKGRRIDKR